MSALSLLPTSPSRRAAACGVIALLLLSACSSPHPPPFQREEFQVNETFSRSFEANEAQTCEAARRALLSQGYVVTIANADLVNARKSFQPAPENHVEIEFRVVCTAQRKGSKPTLAFVSALQDRYALKKGSNSASVGVGVIGSVSLPFSSTDDSLVKVASETVTSANFYDRFFKLIGNYLVSDQEPVAAAPLGLPPPVPAASAPAPAAAPAAGSASEPR
ncbi:MAG TPA: DUF2242 domain-containing protein [Burkholderiaceae bacterium]|nr:DUF2242 domain-containing protein [Burkholderiaceae bacterium]